jgi:hypothetical protein
LAFSLIHLLYSIQIYLTVLDFCNRKLLNVISEWVKWLLFNVKWVIFHLYHNENKLRFKLIDDDDDVRIVLDKHDKLDFYSAGSLNQQSVDRHVTPIEHTILIPSQPLLLHNAACLTEKQHIPIFKGFGLIWPRHKLLYSRRAWLSLRYQCSCYFLLFYL